MKRLFQGTAIMALAFVFLLAASLSVGAYYEYADNYEDATYRGIFADGDSIQVNVQFTLEDNTFTDLSFRQLYYGGIDYLEEEDGTYYELAQQHKEALQYLDGRSVSEVDDLFNPEDAVEEYAEVDGFTAATMRANKIISAVRDALNRGPYSY